jgi:hypothetical protein
MEILIYFGVLWIGVIFGYFIRVWIGYKSSYSGTIYVTKTDHKTLYALELEEYPEEIRFKKELVFKVDASKLDIEPPEDNRK